MAGAASRHARNSAGMIVAIVVLLYNTVLCMHVIHLFRKVQYLLVR